MQANICNEVRRKTNPTISLVLLLVIMSIFSKADADAIEIGQAAPDFNLLDQSGQEHSLSKYAGSWVILYFYPKDDTPGCTKQACAFRDEYQVIAEHNTQVLGVSVDDEKSHAAFADKYNLPFPLLADKDGSVAKSYQALTSLGIVKFAKRHTFIIGPQGTIQKIYRKVNVDNHSQEILADLQSLKASDL